MPYKISRARKEFEVRVSSLKRNVRVASIKKLAIPYEIQQLTFHAAILESSASLEEYIKMLFLNFEHAAVRQPLEVNKLPPKWRSFIFFNSTRPVFENYFYSREERRMLNSLDIDGGLFDIAHAGTAINQNMKLSSVLDGRKYPSPGNWDRLFQRLGVTNIFGEVSSVLKRDSKSILESFNDVRTAIAHEYPPGLTVADVLHYLDNLLHFVRGIDRVTYRHLYEYAGESCWLV